MHDDLPVDHERDARRQAHARRRRGARTTLGIDANPKATSLEDVLSYSQLHGMLHACRFLTSSLPQLRRVWKAYAVQADIERG